jgi:hypothetical protein
MASLYEQLMASKGAPKAAAATNSTQLRKAPVSLRSAMRKYAEGGGVGSSSPSDADIASFVQANINNPQAIAQAAQQYGVSSDALARATGYSSGQVNDYFGNAGINFGGSRSEPVPQTMSPSTNDFDRFKQDMEQTRRPPERPPEPRYEEPRRPERPPERPIYEEPRLYEEPPRPRNPDRETPYIVPTTPQAPQTSYRMNDDGSRTEIGYDGQPIANYTPEQLAMHLATTGVTPPEYRYVWNGQGYDKLPNGPQTGYGPTPDIAEPKFPERERPPEPRYEEPQRPDPMDFRREQEAEEERRRKQESRDRQREAEEYYFRMRNAQSEEPRYEEPIAPPMPYYPEMPMPETYIEPEVNFSTDPGFYQPPVYDNPAIEIAKGLQGGDIGKLLQDLTLRSGGRTGGDLAKLLADLIARNGGGGSLEEQRRLMELLGSIRG